MARVKIVLIGYGQHAISILSALSHLNAMVIGYTDKSPSSDNIYGLNYLGNDDHHLMSFVQKHSVNYICGIGDNTLRKFVQQKYENKGCRFINIIHPSAIIENTTIIGRGVFIGAQTYINGSSKIGDGTIINNHVNVEHGCELESFVHLAPSVSLAGNVTVQSLSFIGIGSVVIPNIQIGRNTIVGAGTVIITDIQDNSKVVGNPARYLENG